MTTSPKEDKTKHTKESWEQEGLNITAFGRGIIAECPTPQEGGVFECSANAKLIASAPSLLEALKECEEYFDKRADVDYADEYIANSEMQLLVIVRKAIQNAENQKP